MLETPITLEDAPVDVIVSMVFPPILMVVEVFEEAMPVTFPPAPVDFKPEILLLSTAIVVAVFTEFPMVIPLIAPCPLIFEIVLEERDELPFHAVTLKRLMVAAPVLRFAKVFPVIVFVQAEDDSVKFRPVNALAPVNVKPEKLLLAKLKTAPLAPVVPVDVEAMVALADEFTKPPTTELLSSVNCPVPLMA